MPQVKSQNPMESRSKSAASTVIQRPTLSDARELIDKMLDYEAAALKKGVDLSSSRFTRLTSADRQLLRAELVADYIRLSSGETCGASSRSAIQAFCSKICDMSIPSHELIGTYLAAMDVVTSDEYEGQAPGLIESVRKTMPSVLQGCVDHLQDSE